MITRFIEAENKDQTNHGKFVVGWFGPKDFKYTSAVSNRPLLTGLPEVRRFSSINPNSVWLLDLQTQEGIMFDRKDADVDLERRFLIHPVHVCILYYPLLRFIAKTKRALEDLPAKVTLSSEEMLTQPGVLLDARGNVPRRTEWARREVIRISPPVARLRNREVADEADPLEDQETITLQETLQSAGPPPVWR